MEYFDSNPSRECSIKFSGKARVDRDVGKEFVPQGRLLTTLYQHKNAVNSIAVSDDQTFFLTSSKDDKAIFLHKMKNIKEDFYQDSNEPVITYKRQVSIIPTPLHSYQCYR